MANWGLGWVAIPAAAFQESSLSPHTLFLPLRRKCELASEVANPIISCCSLRTAAEIASAAITASGAAPANSSHRPQTVVRRVEVGFDVAVIYSECFGHLDALLPSAASSDGASEWASTTCGVYLKCKTIDGDAAALSRRMNRAFFGRSTRQESFFTLSSALSSQMMSYELHEVPTVRYVSYID